MKLKILIFFLLVASLATLLTGETPIESLWRGVLDRFWGNGTYNPLLDERIPRLIVIICTGASLAVSGAVMQAIFQNPLASPSVLGISCGGSLTVTLVFVFGWHAIHPYTIPFASFSGSLITLVGVYLIAKRCNEAGTTSLILTGIALSTLLLAIQGAITYALRDQWQLIQTITEWEAGTTTDRSWTHVHMQLPLTIVGLLVALYYRKELDILAFGDEEAKNLGVEVTVIRWRLFLSVALLTGGAIASVGIIGFFGLVLPHVIRQLHGPSNKELIPLSILGGAVMLLSLDLLLRLTHIHAFSIGNVSAIFGGLFFLVLLLRGKKREGYARV